MVDPERGPGLLEATLLLVSDLHLDVVLDRVLAIACEMTGARYAALGVLYEHRRELAQFRTRGIDEATQRAIGDLPRGRGVLGVLIDEPRPLRLADVSAHARSYGFPPGHPPMRTFLGVPILIRGEAWGNLYLAEKDEGEFTGSDEQFAVVLALCAGIAIDNARLYEGAEARRLELERAVRSFEATATIAQAVGGETDPERVLELVVKRGRALVEARSVVVLLVEGDELTVAAIAGETDAAPGARVPLAGSTSGEVLRERRPQRVADVPLQAQISPERFGVPEAETALLVPMVYRGRALGVLEAFDRLTGDRRFTSDDERVLQAFASQAAIAVATAKTVEAERLRRSFQAAEAERVRWARELHDETLQGLGGVKLMLGSASRLDDPDEMRAAMREAAAQVAREIDNLRGLISELRPAALDRLGLGPALRSLIRRSSSSTGAQIREDVALDGEGRLDPELETAIYRIVQESLTNVVKHADASHVDVTVRQSHDRLVIEVADDGVGLPDDVAATDGFGLIGMQERVSLLGGTLTVKRCTGRGGTIVRATLPGAAAAGAP